MRILFLITVFGFVSLALQNQTLANPCVGSVDAAQNCSQGAGTTSQVTPDQGANNTPQRTTPHGDPQKIKDRIQSVATLTSHFPVKNLLSVGDEGNLQITGGDAENNILTRIIRLMAMLVGTFAVLLLIIAGYFMMASQGDDGMISKGKKIIQFVALGLVAVFGAYFLIDLLISVLYFT